MDNIQTLYDTANWEELVDREESKKAKKRGSGGSQVAKLLVILLVVVGLAVLLIIKWPYYVEKTTECLLENTQAVRAGTHVFVSQGWLDKYGLNLQQTAKDLMLDHDNDGLNVFGEYTHMTDPLNADTDNDGYEDGLEVANDYDPRGLGRLDTDSDSMPDYWERANTLDVERDDTYLDPDRDNLPNSAEYFHLTDPQNNDTDLDGSTDYVEIMEATDPTGEGRPRMLIKIDKIGVEAPIVWSQSTDEAVIQKDLENGVVRYPDEDTNGLPGRPGNLFITGHSSDYLWKSGEYKYVFAKLNDLEVGDKVIITTIQANGREIDYEYQIYDKEIVEPDNQRLFLMTDEPILTLVTCWPMYTNRQRLMLRGALSGVE